MPRPRQIALPLPHRPGLAVEDFIVGESNRRAYDMVMRWPAWPACVLIISGPEGSGKSHLAQIWMARAGAVEVDAARGLETLPHGFAAVVEDLPGTRTGTELFHLMNHAREMRGHLLFTSRLAAAAWNVTLPDLASRLTAALQETLGPPDDAMLRQVLAKLFHDRQLRAGEPLISYLLHRMPRSFAAARDIVAALDQLALEEKTDITRTLAARVLGEWAEPELFK